jgi:tetratricopeptide (TPR) repeat protein
MGTSAHLKAEALLDRAYELRDRGDDEEAIRGFRSILNMNDSSGKALRELAIEGIIPPLAREAHRLWKQQKRGGSRKIFCELVEISRCRTREHAMARIDRGVFELEAGNPQAALEDFTTVIDDEESPPDQIILALNNRAGAYVILKHYDLALLDAKDILSSDHASQRDKVRARISRALAQSALGRSQEACDDLHRMTLAPDLALDLRVRATQLLSQLRS